MARAKSATICILVVLHSSAFARGVSPYLPLNLEPEIERQIERVLILGDQPVMTRPIAAATVLDALPKACNIDHVVCMEVKRYLMRYTHNRGITHASVEGAVTHGSGSELTAPNRYGMSENSHWDASAQLYWQPSDYLIVNAGAVGYAGRTNYSGSMLSLGFDFAQLDIGFRPHWFSPLSDSSMLMSTEAPTSPSVTLSNYRPFTRFGLRYEFFAASLSNSDRIVFGDGFTSGHPRLAGFHLETQPATGWSLGVNRVLEYGGGARGGNSIRDLFNAFFNPSKYDNTSPTNGQQAGNQQASITSSLLFPGRVPFSVYFEYAGEDTSHGRNYLLGNSALSLGIHFPRLFRRFDLTLETTEWQNGWYVHSVYLDGMTNYGHVVGNWFGDQQVFQDGVGGHSAMASIGWDPSFGGALQLKYRRMQNASYGDFKYKTMQDVSLEYSRPFHGVVLGGQVDGGRDSFGGSFTRLSGFVRYDEGGEFAASLGTIMSDNNGDEPGAKAGEIFIDTGANTSQQSVDLTSTEGRSKGARRYGSHLAVGARRFVSEHSDLGTRIEFDNVQGHSLIGARLIDYRYRFNNPLALSFFFGANRYALATPAYGLYLGAGIQWRNIFPGLDIGIDERYADSIARDHLLPTDPPNVGGQNDSFYNILSTTLSLSYHF